jgi:hypothetical protein
VSLLLIAAALGCHTAAPSAEGRAAPAPIVAAVAKSPTSTDPHHSSAALVRIEAFDCEKVLDLPGVAPSTGLVTATNGIRGWHGGGPHGANWNVEDLRCTARIVPHCNAGDLHVTFRVGAGVVAGRQVHASASAPVDVEIEVASKAWNRLLDIEPRGTSGRRPFSTAVLRATAELSCLTPEASLRDHA